MVVLSLTDVPMALKGDLSKWMLEINSGVFVGSFSARVRDELWERVCENIKNGKATMVYSTNGEQGMDFRVHNTSWQPVDYDGLKLIKKRFNPGDILPDGFSKAAKYRKIQRIQQSKKEKEPVLTDVDSYTVIDIETTGLRPEKDEITEIAAVKCTNGVETASFCKLIRVEQNLRENIIKLTGITDEILQSEGENCGEVMRAFTEFVGDSEIVCHNAAFDIAFINHVCELHGLPKRSNTIHDTLDMAKEEICNQISSYKLTAIAQYFDIAETQTHRALADCRLTAAVYEKLKAMKQK